MSFHCTKMQCNYRAYTWIVCETAINLLIDSEQCIEFEYVVLPCNSYYRMRIQCLNCVALCLQADCRKKSVSPACSIAEGRMPPQSMAHIIINFVSYRVLERTNEIHCQYCNIRQAHIQYTLDQRENFIVLNTNARNEINSNETTADAKNILTIQFVFNLGSLQPID